MAELIVKEIVNPFITEDKMSEVELKLYSSLLRNKKKLNDNNDIVQDLYSQLIDINENIDKNMK